MNSFTRALRFTFFTVWAVMMTGLTYVLGAPSLKVLRRRLGRVNYWGLTTLMGLGLFATQIGATSDGPALDLRPLAVAFYSLVILIGVFEELEELGLSLMASAFFTLVINALLAGGALALWITRAGVNWPQLIQSVLENWLKPVTELNPHLQINYFDLMVQLPSIIVILWMLALYVAVWLEPRLSVGEMATPGMPPTFRPQLATYRLPDACIWIFLASLLGAFLDLHVKGVEAVSINVMNLSLVLFFFQGLAVVGKLFQRLKLAMFWQVLFMILVVVQLFLFVSLLGLVDYWVDFRTRLAKRAGGPSEELTS